ncbi:vezatin-like isoform X1 [Scylla paramamosain]|uniref:vezatin-like isoform X1 n=2 Tax=Scylla paramamosain TaxID=85552 RepID=UPI0030832A9E
MEDEEDEEVVFEGSAIHQHLLDVGYTDFEQSTYTPPPCPEEAPDGGSSDSQARSGWLEAGRGWCTRLPLRLFGVAPAVQSYVYMTVARAVSRSRLVNEDDWLVLEHFLPRGEELQASANTDLPWPTAVLKCRDVAVMVVCLLLLWIGTEDLYFQLSLLVVALTTCGLYCMYWLQKMASLEQFISSLKEMNNLTSKTVRLLQEMDLIGKGFVLAQGPGAPMASLYEESPHMSCLSEALLCTVTAAAKVLVSAHTALEPGVPHYPVIRHLFDEPPSLEQNCTLTQQLQYMKSRVTVIKLQTSAVLTELLLWLHGSEGDFKYRTVVDFIATSYKKDAFIEKMQSLKKQYEYNKCFWLMERPTVNASPSIEEKKKNVYVAVHSLGLHLQAALARVQSLESDYERENDTSGLCEPESLEAFPSYEHFKAQLNALRLELDSCQGCIEEAEVRAARKYGAASESNEQKASVQYTASEDEQVEQVTAAKPPAILLYDQQIAPAEDEVFEADVNDRLSDEEASVLDDDTWCTDARKEKQMLRQQKEQGKRVLRELQPILVSRRKMWEEREKVALEKLRTRPVEQNIVKVIEKEDGTQRKESADDQTDIAPVNTEELNTAALRGVGPQVPIQASEIGVEDEVDSDEERLAAYKKIRQELDEDEEERIVNEVRLKAAALHSYSGEGERPFLSSLRKRKNMIGDCGDSDSGEETVSVPRQRPPVDFCWGDDERERDSSCEEMNKVEEETFTHNENMKDDESRQIDWTTFALPTHHTASLDDRLNLYSGSSCLGFQAEVAAQASAASKNFWMASKKLEETFGGTGEGEVFGDSSEDETDKDTDDEK